ncbi:MAG: hypothetical protein ACHQ3P_02395 [Candidatus Limnocylindrales bacterium]
MPHRRVSVRILHVEPSPSSGPFERLLERVRLENGERHLRAFREVGADDVDLVVGQPDDTSFGELLGGLLAGLDRGAGLVVLGSGSMPLATVADRRAFIESAGGIAGPRTALANNRYSADAIAIADAADLPKIPALPGDNAIGRWLAERAGWTVTDLTARWRLQVDLDSPLDAVLTGQARREPPLDRVRERLDAVRAVAADRRSELLVAGRTSAASLRWLESHTACRVRALIEERGLRASSLLAVAGGAGRQRHGADERRDGTAVATRPPRSALGLILDRDGPEALGARLAELADAAVVDSRVLMAHRLGADERAWPAAEDRFASDLLLPDGIVDPWLRALTRAAAEAPIPVVLGGHTLVGPGVRLAVGRGGRR